MLIEESIGQVRGRGMCRSASDPLLAPVLGTSPLWWEPLILHTKQGKHSTNHTSERLQDTSIPWVPGGNVTGSTGTRGSERDLEEDPPPPLVHFSRGVSNSLLRTSHHSQCRCSDLDFMRSNKVAFALVQGKMMHISVTVATPRSTPPLTPLPMVPSSDVCQCMLVCTPRESTPHCQNILGS